MSERGQSETQERPSFPLPGRGRGPYLECVRFLETGEASEYTEAHRIARWVLGLLDGPPVACRRCGILDTELELGQRARMHAALNWQSAAAAGRLVEGWRGQIFSVRPDLDYIPLCASCHRKHDSWRTGLPPIPKAAS